MILALRPGGRGKGIMQCLDCKLPDPLKSDAAKGWLTIEGGHSVCLTDDGRRSEMRKS